MSKRLFVLAACLFTLASPARGAPPQEKLEANILNLRNSVGVVRCALYDSAGSFPKDTGVYKDVAVPIQNAHATCVFDGVPPGAYAIAVFHDEHKDGKMHYRYGLPTEGFGFSRDASAWVGAPKFSAASFDYRGGQMKLAIRMRYILSN